SVCHDLRAIGIAAPGMHRARHFGKFHLHHWTRAIFLPWRAAQGRVKKRDCCCCCHKQHKANKRVPSVSRKLSATAHDFLDQSCAVAESLPSIEKLHQNRLTSCARRQTNSP